MVRVLIREPKVSKPHTVINEYATNAIEIAVVATPCIFLGDRSLSSW
jgi:hypothetical protein